MNNIPEYCSPHRRNELVEASLNQRLQSKYAQVCLKSGICYSVLLLLLLYNKQNNCPFFAHVAWCAVEGVLIALVAFYAVGCLLFYAIFLLFRRPLRGTEEQRKLLGYDVDDSMFVIESSLSLRKQMDRSVSKSEKSSFMDWHSISFNEPRQIAACRHRRPDLLAPGRLSHFFGQENTWTAIANDCSLRKSYSSSENSPKSNTVHNSKEHIFLDERSLQQHLRDNSFELCDLSQSDVSEVSDMHNISGFRILKNELKQSRYQLSPSAEPLVPRFFKREKGLKIIGRNNETIEIIPVEKVMEMVSNLRMWIVVTILKPLVKEIEKIDTTFEKSGFVDMKLGLMGLDRLKQMAALQNQVDKHVPVLPFVVPFLDLPCSQEYLVQRIKDMSKSSCISDYHWNSGAPYHGLQWDEHLPTDAAIIFHLFCVYMDCQLLPLPQGCSNRPFYSRYVVELEENCHIQSIIKTVKNREKCVILCVDRMKPTFNFVSDNVLHSAYPDRNNMFHVIIQFLNYVNSRNNGRLEGVSLGGGGFNILCVIDK